MSSAALSHQTKTPIAANISSLWLTTLILAAGLGVANVYYMQPLLQQVGQDFNLSTQSLGYVATAVQLGYALGMLLLVPLGDMFERRRLMVMMTTLAAVACAGVSAAPSAGWLTVASFVLGLCSITPQYAIPFAAQLAAASERGRVVGYVVSGLLMGILLARTLSGFVGAAYGWRAMFAAAMGIQVGLALSLQLLLPQAHATYRGSYAALLRSIVTLWRMHPMFREACFAGATMFGAFSAFWATLILLLEKPPFGLGARAVGLFGLVGAAGALATPLVGRVIDRYDPKALARCANGLAMLAFVGLYVGRRRLWGVTLGVLVLDIAVQTAHVCNQGRIFALLPEARSRANTAYMFCYFCGGTMGSALAVWAFAAIGWGGTCLVGLNLLALGAARLAWPWSRPTRCASILVMALVLRTLGFLTIGLCCCAVAQASSLRYLNLQQLTDASELVVRGRAVHQESFWQNRRIVTRVRVAVDEVWVGRAPASQEVEVLTLGGVVGDIGQRVDGAAVLPQGRDLVVQLAQGEGEAFWPVALSQGVWVLAPHDAQDAADADASMPIAVTRPSTDRLVASDANPMRPMPSCVQALKAAILEAAHGR